MIQIKAIKTIKDTFSEGEIIVKLDDTNSKVFNGLRIANKPDETGAHRAKILSEDIPVIPEDKAERERAFEEGLRDLKENYIPKLAEALKKHFKR